MKNKWILYILLLLVIVFWIWSRSCRVPEPVEERTPTILSTASGIESTEFQMHDSILFEASDLLPNTGYEIEVVREDGRAINTLRLSTDQQGRIPVTVLWYDIGILPCPESSAHTAHTSFSEKEISDFSYAGKSYTLKILKDATLVREMTFSVLEKMIRPTLYAVNSRGCPRSGFLIGEEDVWVVGKNFPKGSIIRLWAVPADSEWKDGEPFKDVTKQYAYNMPPLFELEVNEGNFKKLLWPKGLTSIGSYDIVAEAVTYAFGAYHESPSAQAQNVVSNLSYSGFVVQRRQGVAEPLEMNIAGAVQSPFTFRDTFLTTENVYVGVDPSVQPGYVGQTADIYIVADKTDAQWTTNQNLVDVTGVVETITVGGICGNCWKTLAWTAPLTPGQYDVVLDFNQDGLYTPGVDLIDALDPVGFTVAEIRVDSISFNYTGSGAVTIYDNVNGNNITSPEYVSAGHVLKPSAWVMGGFHSVQVNFKAVPTVNTAQIWAENGLGGLNSSGSPITLTFTGGSGQGTFSVNSVPVFVDKNLFYWDWKYKNVNGASSGNLEMGETGEHILYSVLATPQAPQTVPWLSALDIACDLAQGQNTATAAARDIWDDFYNNAGGLYDTTSGAPQYTGSTTTNFDLTSWLTHYDSGNIGVVNCYDMGKAVVVFANALGCGAVYTYVGPFGYLNCVKPIGRGWANNPFYDNVGYNSNPIVNGDWSSADGRSGFGNHGFTRLNGSIYDGSGGQVDVDGDPDGGPPHTARELDGDDTWASDYRNRVIDNNPVSNPGTPTDYNFSVY